MTGEEIVVEPFSEEHGEYLRRKAERIENLRAELARLCAAADGRELTLEIGCGHGHWLSAYAKAHPDEYCLGLDLVTHRINRCLKKVDRLGVTNCVFMKAEAMEVLTALPKEMRLAKSFLLFPDPWPKSKHRKKRLVQQKFLSELASFQESGTRFYFRTDHETYFDWTHKHLVEHPQWQIDHSIEWPFEEESWFQGILGEYRSMISVRV